MRRMMFLTVLMALVLSGCGQSMNGKYVGQESFFFGMGQTTVHLDVDGDKAVMIVGGSKPSKVQWDARVEKDLLVLTSGRDRLDFNIRDKGRLLQCVQCKSITRFMPDTFRRVET